MMVQLECIECKATYPDSEIIYRCPKCGGLLDVVYDYSNIDFNPEKSTQPPSVWKYKPLLPIKQAGEADWRSRIVREA